MNFKLLGTAAGGGLPQWNCACTLCDLCRNFPEIVRPRLQLQAAFSTDAEKWFLINASPDLRFQIESNPELQPSALHGKRNTPIQGIILTSADLDQVLGLLLLREFQPLTIYSTGAVRRVLEANSFFRMLERVPKQLTWVEIEPGKAFTVGDSDLHSHTPGTERFPTMHVDLPQTSQVRRRSAFCWKPMAAVSPTRLRFPKSRTPFARCMTPAT